MNNLNAESALKLQKILNKRLKRNLSKTELENAYEALRGFAVALVELSEPTNKRSPKASKIRNKIKTPIAMRNENTLQYV